MNEISKTVIVLDCLPYFFESCKQMIDFDMHTKQKGSAIYHISPISKSMWTCALEAAMEYARIIYDLFPNEKLIQLIINGKSTCSINNWNLIGQTFQFLTNALSHFPYQNFIPTANTNISLDIFFSEGFKKALEILSQMTQYQKERKSEGIVNLSNFGHVIYLTSVKKKDFIYKLEKIASDLIDLQNEVSTISEDLLKIHGIKLSIIDIYPLDLCDNSTIIELREVSPFLYSEFHNSQSGKFLALKMVEIAMRHYNLSSTTVTGIPMKEEQNAQSSANYDVDLLHDQNVYIDLIKMGYLNELSSPSKELLHSQTILLKWCTPKTLSTEMHQCSSAYRVTPVDVISRPSSCLINFLLGGRGVMLEQHRKSGVKVTSHMLTSHGGEVYIHTLAMANCKRSPLEDPRSISEGVGGQITDYRINDFNQLIRDNRLAPYANLNTELASLEAAKSRLVKVTKYWPMLISETIIFNIMHITEPLITAILKSEIFPTEVLDCCKVIHQLLTMESKNEALLSQPNTTAKVKASKRESHYHKMWLELEKFLRAHRDSSPGHEKVLECLLENGRAHVTEEERGKKQIIESKINDEKNLVETIDIKKRKHNEESEDLLTVWLNLLESNRIKRKEEFHGRLEAVNGKTQLYKNLNQKDNGGSVAMET